MESFNEYSNPMSSGTEQEQQQQLQEDQQLQQQREYQQQQLQQNEQQQQLQEKILTESNKQLFQQHLQMQQQQQQQLQEQQQHLQLLQHFHQFQPQQQQQQQQQLQEQQQQQQQQQQQLQEQQQQQQQLQEQQKQRQQQHHQVDLQSQQHQVDLQSQQHQLHHSQLPQPQHPYYNKLILIKSGQYTNRIGIVNDILNDLFLITLISENDGSKGFVDKQEQIVCSENQLFLLPDEVEHQQQLEKMLREREQQLQDEQLLLDVQLQEKKLQQHIQWQNLHNQNQQKLNHPSKDLQDKIEEHSKLQHQQQQILLSQQQQQQHAQQHHQPPQSQKLESQEKPPHQKMQTPQQSNFRKAKVEKSKHIGHGFNLNGNKNGNEDDNGCNASGNTNSHDHSKDTNGMNSENTNINGFTNTPIAPVPSPVPSPVPPPASSPVPPPASSPVPVPSPVPPPVSSPVPAPSPITSPVPAPSPVPSPAPAPSNIKIDSTLQNGKIIPPIPLEAGIKDTAMQQELSKINITTTKTTENVVVNNKELCDNHENTTTAVEISTIVKDTTMNDSKEPVVEDELVHVLFESFGKRKINKINESCSIEDKNDDEIIITSEQPLPNHRLFKKQKVIETSSEGDSNEKAAIPTINEGKDCMKNALKKNKNNKQKMNGKALVENNSYSQRNNNPPLPSFPSTSHCIWTFDPKSRTMLAKFRNKKRAKLFVSKIDEQFMATILNRDDITIASQGLVNLVNKKLWDLDRTGRCIGDKYYHKIRKSASSEDIDLKSKVMNRTIQFQMPLPPLINNGYYQMPLFHPPGRLDVYLTKKDDCCVVETINSIKSLFQIGDIIDWFDGQPLFRLDLDIVTNMLKLSTWKPSRYFSIRRQMPSSSPMQNMPTSSATLTKGGKMQLQENKENLTKIGICSKCNEPEKAYETAPMLLCDGCDKSYHLSCVKMASIPEGDWLCHDCLEILDARRKFYHNPNDVSKFQTLEVKPPPLPILPSSAQELAVKASKRFIEYFIKKKERMNHLDKEQQIVEYAMGKSIEDLEHKVSCLQIKFNDSKINFESEETLAATVMRRDHGIAGYSGKIDNEWIDSILPNGDTQRIKKSEHQISVTDSETNYSQTWKQLEHKTHNCELGLSEHRKLLAESEKNFKTCQAELVEMRNKERLQTKTNKENRKVVLVEISSMLGERKHDFETKSSFENRETKPLFIGVYKPENKDDVQILNILRDSIEAVVAIPMDDSEECPDILRESISVHQEYAIFGRSALFSAERDDHLPMDFSNVSIRNAQRRFMDILMRDPKNEAATVTKPIIPSSVKVRGETNNHEETVISSSKFFDLSELVRDCDYHLTKPKASTPKRLADNGLVLRDYQLNSLQWMLDKENNPTGLGVAGEFWYRMQALDGGGDYFYCDITGSFLKDIFDIKSDTDQDDDATYYGSLPAGGILGEEMGLGKTIICLALVHANPPPKHNQILPREHIETITHSSYTKPPSVVGCTSFHDSKIKLFLSNSSLVIAPIFLCSQWESEIKKMAPWMSVLTLKSSEKVDVRKIATSDIIVISTFALQNTTELFKQIKSIHYHRIFVDESHHNQSVKNINKCLKSISSTYRYCVTGAPVGRSLYDLQEQLRFLRLPHFHRTSFWKQNITPYYSRNCASLQVLRSLLSRVVIHHSKEQTLESGKAIISLPSRTIEILPFGSDAERKMYEELENKNTKRFITLQKEAPNTVIFGAPFFIPPGRLGSHPSKYSAEKVKARIFSDGSVMPASTPKKTEDGLFLRPAGRQRKGMDWDPVKGKWIPIKTAPTEQQLIKSR